MREDVIQSAVNFLQDPSVASSPLERRIAFLQAKNLTQEELINALQRSGVDSSTLENHGVQAFNSVQRMPPPTFTGGGYGGGFYPQQGNPAMQDPGRDWRDWFVMATVTSSVSYGVYYLAKRYVVPLIAPPTPEALESDKKAIDTAFSDAFSLLDSLKSDTEALKDAEEKRNTRVDQALEEVERVVESLKDASKRREEESKRVNDEVRNLKDLIPKALEGQKESQSQQLKDLQSELKSLKALLVNRAGSRLTSNIPPAQSAVYHPPAPVQTPSVQQPAPTQDSSAGSGSAATYGAGQQQQQQPIVNKPFSAITGGNRSIPAWQLAAAAKANGSGPSSANSSTTGDASAAAAAASAANEATKA